MLPTVVIDYNNHEGKRSYCSAPLKEPRCSFDEHYYAAEIKRNERKSCDESHSEREYSYFVSFLTKSCKIQYYATLYIMRWYFFSTIITRMNFANPPGKIQRAKGVLVQLQLYDRLWKLFSEYPKSCMKEECKYIHTNLWAEVYIKRDVTDTILHNWLGIECESWRAKIESVLTWNVRHAQIFPTVK